MKKDTELLDLAKLMHKFLRCHCGYNPIKAQKEPCLCGWTPIEDWFTDHGIYFDELRVMTKDEREEWEE